MAVSDTTQWAIFGILSVLIVLGIGLWIKYMPRYREYRKKIANLDALNEQYEELRKKRKDLVFHFYWSLDSGNQKDADLHESEVLDIDKNLTSIRDRYSIIEKGG
jgi:hypothetical protein